MSNGANESSGETEDLHGVTRRSFLKILGASIALAGLGGCEWFQGEEILPYVDQPENVIPGKPTHYASTFVMRGFAEGIVARTDMARPTKLEGNSHHPRTRGASDPFMQAHLLSLYDPERGKVPSYRGTDRSWSELEAWLRTKSEEWRKNHGRGLRILTETITSPTLGAELRALLARYPEARWHQYEPFSRDSVLEGARIAYGRMLSPVYRIDQAEVILSLDSDFLYQEIGHLAYSRDFADGRRVRSDRRRMSRLYCVESATTITGAMADHRLPLQASRILPFAISLARRLGIALRSLEGPGSQPGGRFLEEVASDLGRARGRCLVLAGEDQPPELHALAHAINSHLGNLGRTMTLIDPPEQNPVNQLDSLRSLVSEMSQGRVETLLILGGNPVYTAPVDLGFEENLHLARHSLKFGLHPDETSYVSDWYLPESHGLESWGDARAIDGLASPIQPVVAPLYQTRDALQLVATVSGPAGRLDRDLLRGYWNAEWQKDRRLEPRSAFEDFWSTSLHQGFFAGTAFQPISAAIRLDSVSQALAGVRPPPEHSGLELTFRPDPRVWDGRYSNNSWLQELPKPLTQLTWDNAVFVSPATAASLGLKDQQVVRIELRGRSAEGPVLIVEGQPENSIGLNAGYGRRHAGSVGDGHGFDVFTLRFSDERLFAPKPRLLKTGRTTMLARRQLDSRADSHRIVRHGPLRQFILDPTSIVPPRKRQESLVPDYDYKEADYAWGMVIDLNVCIGCKTCTIACQAENNIPVVGKAEVNNGRAMHWIRVDRYYDGSSANPDTYFQPVPCMQCEKAPCELVCPTEATVHSSEGINQMVYNRCVGTRFCSNNCPYKVRRFNFFQYADLKTPVLRLLRNPDVTVRSQGVMEKCTYCIQRINAAKITAEIDGRKIREGEVLTACQSACPTRAIHFGDLNDGKSEVSRLKKEPLDYNLLDELDTRPRTSYLAALKNRNSALEGPA